MAQANKEKLQKKLPKRAGRRKDFAHKREVQHERARRRKEAWKAEIARREEKNRQLRAAGLPTPWEVAKAKARARRLGV
jgi:hypothetical protein